jgi:HEAT repeat protein
MADEPPPDRRAHLDRALAAIAGQGTLSRDELDALNVLEGAPLERFRQVWSELDAPARVRLIERLRAGAEERQRLDFGPINRLALEDESPEVRLAGVQAALEDRQPRLMHRLLDMLRSDPSVEVRQAAAEDAARFALLAELGDLDAESARLVRQRLIEAARDPREDSRVRQAALAAAGYFSDPEMGGLLTSGFADADLRLGAVRGMGRSADPRWTEQILNVLDDPDPRLRLEAVRALGEIEDERAVEVLSDLVDDPDEAVQLAAIRALGDIGGDEARETLLYLLEDTSQPVREAAEAAIRELEFYEDPLGL